MSLGNTRFSPDDANKLTTFILGIAIVVAILVLLF
jgi:hypothetical protein